MQYTNKVTVSLCPLKMVWRRRRLTSGSSELAAHVPRGHAGSGRAGTCQRIAALRSAQLRPRPPKTKQSEGSASEAESLAHARPRRGRSKAEAKQDGLGSGPGRQPSSLQWPSLHAVCPVVLVGSDWNPPAQDLGQPDLWLLQNLSPLAHLHLEVVKVRVIEITRVKRLIRCQRSLSPGPGALARPPPAVSSKAACSARLRQLLVFSFGARTRRLGMFSLL